MKECVFAWEWEERWTAGCGVRDFAERGVLQGSKGPLWLSQRGWFVPP